MDCPLVLGAAIAAMIGLIHAWRVYQQYTGSLTDHPVAVKLSAIYYGVWTFILWTLCGSYLVYFWVTSAAIYGFYRISKSFGKLIEWR